MTILIVGAGGQVGSALAQRLGARSDVVLATRNGSRVLGHPTRVLDVTDLAAIDALVRELRPTTVINASGYTAVDRAELEPDVGKRVNADAPGVMAQACAGVAARFVHFSTDYVFDGTSTTPYRETDATAPLGEYGRSKLAGEQAALAAGADTLILRTAWVYAAIGSNFLRTMLRLADARDVVRVVDDQIGCPTSAGFIADATLTLLATPTPSPAIVNVVAAGTTSWYGFADAIFDEAVRRGLLARRPRLDPITTADFPTPARRPAYSVLDTSRLRTLGVTPPDWRQDLNGVLDELAAETPAVR